MRRTGLGIGIFCLLLPALAGSGCADEPPGHYRTWEVYGGDAGGTRYSSLHQIDRSNVAGLEVAWVYQTGDAFEGSEMQCNPIVVGGLLYATTPRLRVIALDAATGELRWSYDPASEDAPAGKARNRGVAYWGEGEERRIFFAAGHHLYALDAASGRPAEDFGRAGRVDLRQGLDRDPESVFVRATTPGVVHGDLLILGSLVNETLPAAPGDIRAFDVRSGELRWSFRTIPRPAEFGAETWPEGARGYLGGANSWAGLALDAERGIVYCPTGSAAFDFYGGNRAGDNLFANTLLALDAGSRQRIWHFQAVRHDVWDRDFPAQPTLVTLRREGRRVDAVAQLTKSGHVFVFDRESGEPLFPIEEHAAAPSEVPGERLAGSQPLPAMPPPFARQVFTEDMLTRRTPGAHQAVLEQFRSLRSQGQFTPPSFEGTVIFPGFDGGAEWGGAAFDPETGLLYVNSNEMPWILKVLPRPPLERPATAQQLYQRDCAACHGADRAGSPPEIPALTAVSEDYSAGEIAALIREGGGRMPAAPHLGTGAVQALAEFLLSGRDRPVDPEGAGAPPFQVPYTIAGYDKFLDPDGYPAVEPPWGTLNAIDLERGEIRWTVPLGEFPELAAAGVPTTGTENYGGPVVTAGGLLFIGATNHDRKMRAFDKASGELLWEAGLPAGGNATPAVYEAAGRQFVVIAAGGGKSGSPSGGSYVAFALPR